MREGHIYRDTATGALVKCVHVPETAGVPTHRAESRSLEFETLADGEWFSTYWDNRDNYDYVAESEADLDADQHPARD